MYVAAHESQNDSNRTLPRTVNAVFDVQDLKVNKLWTKQYRRYEQPSAGIEFKLSATSSTTINRRTCSLGG